MISGVTDLIDDLQWRGLVAQSTDQAALRAALAGGSLMLYAGFDPTADSLHAGNLVPLLTLRRFQLAGHSPIVLAGGATGLIGDPSGRSAERTLNTPERVREMAERIRGQLETFLEFDGPHAATMVNNLDWTAGVSALDFMRDIGKHFSINQMLAKESVSARLAEGGISYTEFSYQLLQAADYLHLYRTRGCRLQIGGNDQWGNITAGLDLVRKVTGEQVHAVTVPLITNAAGQKLGKSTGGGSIWLDPQLTSPYAWYQHWVQADDADVISWLKLLTFCEREEIEGLEQQTREQPAARAAQRRLAEAFTTLVHGRAETERVIAASQALFGRGELAELPEPTLAAALREAGSITVGEQPPAYAVLLKDTGLCSSISDARRAIEGGGAYINNVKIVDAEGVPEPSDWLFGRWLVLRRGKRTIAGAHRGTPV
ncbi:MAG: tyrosine--tRNA ligase [Mycobacteriales bacterium]